LLYWRIFLAKTGLKKGNFFACHTFFTYTERKAKLCKNLRHFITHKNADFDRV